MLPSIAFIYIHKRDKANLTKNLFSTALNGFSLTVFFAWSRHIQDTLKNGIVNYIQQLNAFLTTAETRSDLKPMSRLVYVALFKINNDTGWKTVFKATYGQVLSLSGISDVKTYYKAIKELSEQGYIKYIKSTNQYTAASFELVLLNQNTEGHNSNAFTMLNQNTEGHTQSATQSTPNILKQETNKLQTLKLVVVENIDINSVEKKIESTNYMHKDVSPKSSGKKGFYNVNELKKLIISSHKQHWDNVILHTLMPDGGYGNNWSKLLKIQQEQLFEYRDTLFKTFYEQKAEDYTINQPAIHDIAKNFEYWVPKHIAAHQKIRKNIN